MTPKIDSIIQQAGTDCSGKWMGLDHAHKFASLLIKEIEQYIEESNGDAEYIRFLIDRNLKKSAIMDDVFGDLMYQSGLTAQGCWSDLDIYAKHAIEKFGVLVVKECTEVVSDAVFHREPASTYVAKINDHFGVTQ